MKKYIYIPLLISVFVNFPYTIKLSAMPAYPDSVAVIQPNGTQLWTRMHGDEFYHWRTTADGYVIMPNEQKAMVYAQVLGDSLAPIIIKSN